MYKAELVVCGFSKSLNNIKKNIRKLKLRMIIKEMMLVGIDGAVCIIIIM